jgi:lysozyme family protein
MSYSTSFNFCFNAVVGVEGSYTNSYNDPGNWTGGSVGSGVRKGTKYGISAASYPNLDIANLSLDQAQQIYFTDFWTPINGDDFVQNFSLVLFDSAVNQGLPTAIKFAQKLVSVQQDGSFGPITISAIQNYIANNTVITAVSNFQSIRLLSYMDDSGWRLNGLGWANRLFTIAQMAGSIQ